MLVNYWCLDEYEAPDIYVPLCYLEVISVTKVLSKFPENQFDNLQLFLEATL